MSHRAATDPDRHPSPSPFGIVWRGALRHPWMFILPVILIVPWFAYQARNLRLEPRVDLLSPGDPLARSEAMRHATFGDDFRLLVALRKSYKQGGVLSPSALAALRELHDRLEALPGIRRISSLVNAPVLVASPHSPAGAPVWAGAEPEPAIDIFRRLRASEAEKVIFLSPLWSVTPIYLEIEAGIEEGELVREVDALASEIENRHPDAGSVLVVGPAVVESSLSEHIFRDLSGLIPFAVAVVLLGLLLIVRDARLLIVAIVHCLALLALLLGGMASIGWSVNLVSVLAPVVLIPVGVADLLHLFVRLRSGVDEDPVDHGPGRALQRSFARLESPMVGTSATTALGFLGFLVSPVPAIRQFGLTMSAGSVIALLIIFTLDAALLALLWRPSARRRRSRRPKWLRLERHLLALTADPGAAGRLSQTALRAAALVSLASILCLAGLRIDDTWVQNFDPDSRIARDTRQFEQVFLGTNLLALVVQADPSRPEARARAIATVNRMTTEFGLMPGTRGGLSATLIARAFDPEQGLPWKPWPTPSVEAVQEAHARWERQGLVLPRTRMLVDPEWTRFQVQIFVLNRSYGDLVRVVETIRERSETMTGDGVTVALGGNLLSNIRMVRLAVQGQAYSLISLLAVMSILVVAFTRSLRAGAIMMLPMVLAILITYAILVVCGIPYGIAVSMFPTLVLGAAIDFAIHLRTALVRSRGASRSRWARDVAVVVRGVLLNGVLWTTGFAVLTLSQLPPNRYLGMLCSIVFGLSTVTTLLLLPTAWLAAQRGRRPQATGGGRVVAPPGALV